MGTDRHRDESSAKGLRGLLTSPFVTSMSGGMQEVPSVPSPEELETMRSVSWSWDQVRSIVDEVNMATLLAQVAGVRTELVCEVLQDLALFAERTHAVLMRATRDAAADRGGPARTAS
jgi:hypothetical protein